MLPHLSEAPAIEVRIVQSFEPPGGMAEAGTSAVVPAVTNAVFAAPIITVIGASPVGSYRLKDKRHAGC
jgi:CO/xanthine dehydrogenase Mo-binding subunit